MVSYKRYSALLIIVNLVLLKPNLDSSRDGYNNNTRCATQSVVCMLWYDVTTGEVKWKVTQVSQKFSDPDTM